MSHIDPISAKALDETIAAIRARLEIAYHDISAKLANGEDDESMEDSTYGAAGDVAAMAEDWLSDIE